MEAITVSQLTKLFKSLVAVDHISFTVEGGEVFGFLGPNGAGKTTTINMLCTLLEPTSGEAKVNGFDVISQPKEVRRSIGIIFQDPSLDERLTALENLHFHALIYHVSKKIAKERMEKVLEMVGLWERRNDIVRTFSGGMKRRLEIARGLLHYPKILFLDEPTLGLDPQTRNRIWEYIHQLKRQEGITIFLTTHYMDEAENCDRIAIIDCGRIIALDTPDNLKRKVQGDIISLKTTNNELMEKEIEKRYQVQVIRDEDSLHFEIEDGEKFIPQFVASFNPKIKSIGLRRPTLDDVFLKLTGREIREESASAVDRLRMVAKRRGGRMK